MIQETLTYDDIQLIPQYSEIASRADIKLDTALTRRWNIRIPFIATPMDTVCGYEMALEMVRLGGVGVLHRFVDIEQQALWARDIASAACDRDLPVVAAIGATGDYQERALELIEEGLVDVLLIDVAHGHHSHVREAIAWIKSRKEFAKTDIIAGSIATGEAARDLCEWGADGIRVGVGNGALCTTRLQTGHGVPTLSSILACSQAARSYNVPLMTDGGIRYPGDVAKAIAMGADNVMLGSALAGTQEAPGRVVEKRDGSLWKRYRGSASLDTKTAHGLSQRNVEGESTLVPFKGKVKYVIEKFEDGLRSALSYSGAENISKFKLKARWVKVTAAGQIEARPHLIK